MNQLDKELQRAIALDDYRDFGLSTKKTPKKQIEYFEHLQDADMVLLSGKYSCDYDIRRSKGRVREADEEMEGCNEEN